MPSIGGRFGARFGVISDIDDTIVRRSTARCILAPDSEPAAAHAAGEGLIQASELRAVRADKDSDNIASKPALSSGALK